MLSWKGANLEQFPHGLTKTRFIQLCKIIPLFELNASIKKILTFLTPVLSLHKLKVQTIYR